jgi:hypothetical protein
MAKFTLQRGNDGGMRLLKDGEVIDYGDDIPLFDLIKHFGVDCEIVWGDFKEDGDWSSCTFTPDK